LNKTQSSSLQNLRLVAHLIDSRRYPAPGALGTAAATSGRVKVRDVIALLESQGWREVRAAGSHRQFTHPRRTGRVTVSGHPRLEVPLGTLRSIYRQAGLDWKGRPK